METKKDILDTLELRSEAVQDIMSEPPHWMVRWGNTVIFLLLLLILLMSYLIKYPVFVPSTVVISSENPPEKLEVRVNSKVEEIFVQDQQQVSKQQLLMVLQSTADYKDVLHLRAIMDTVTTGSLEHFPLHETAGFKLGEIQADYNAFAKALTDAQLNERLQPYSPEYVAAEQSLATSRSRIQTLQQQKKLEIAKLELSQKEFDRYQQLFGEKVVSAAEMDQARMKLLQAQQNVENVNISISQLQESISGIMKMRSGATINAQKDNINFNAQAGQLFEQLRKSLNAWEQNYLLLSSIDGSVSFQQFLGKNQFVKQGEVLFSIMPKERDLLMGRLQVPSVNSGKVKCGQKVLVKLDNYPYQEFGMVEGTVRNMASAPDKNGNYYVYILLPKGLQTSFHKKLPFDRELRGNAEIVTQDLRLIERVFYQLRKLLGYQY
ncbi:MAG: HlyD family efflux transporter periplasmic adaptor subunit [Chitinophaga sp.]|uniref:HlyD family secretion protein n=1 Tax=Chitinophaga sp. TaxID=1869181 RepID=UPI0025BA69E1|nr:HlyD family efflux transporter periplasmic adaptor subunit [Chitinophaga sp.]MBV8252636.1 HlyD family efflux transporter periplasmic adaptor subunit [Chitinophaga sp.]